MLGFGGLFDDHHVEELSEGVHHHAVNSISMSCVLKPGADPCSLVWVKRAGDCITITVVGIIKKIYGLLPWPWAC